MFSFDQFLSGLHLAPRTLWRAPSGFRRLGCIALAVTLIALSHSGAAIAQSLELEDAQVLSAFGERPAFSPDGRHIAFVDKAYGDAFEVNLASGRVRNLTGQVPHHGILRVQYLASGDFLVSAPRVHDGPNSRINVDLFVLDRDLTRGLRPLDQGVFEGVALGPNNRIAWQQLPAHESLRPGEPWIGGLMRIEFEHYVGRILLDHGRARIVDRQRILQAPPPGCGFAEVQDFRDSGDELVFYCSGVGPGATASQRRMGVYGLNLRTGEYIAYAPLGERYIEAEGIAPSGAWMAVECSDAVGATLPPLDICRLDLRPNGVITPLVTATQPGRQRGLANPVISPDGGSIAFQRADAGVGDPGQGQGIYTIRLTP